MPLGLQLFDPSHLTPSPLMETFTASQYLEHYNNEYNSQRICKALTALLPPSNTGFYPFSVIDSTFYDNFDALVLVPPSLVHKPKA